MTVPLPDCFAVVADIHGNRWALDWRGWQVDHIDVPYDCEAAVTAAGINGRDDWAAWLRTGVAQTSGGIG